MSTKRDSRIGWKKEAAALVAGLLLGSAWEAAHAGVPIGSWGATGQASRAAPAHRS